VNPRSFLSTGAVSTLIKRLAGALALTVSCVNMIAAGQTDVPTAPASIVSPFVRLTIDSRTGHCEVSDQKAGVVWGNSEPAAPFGHVAVQISGHSSRWPLERCDLQSMDQQRQLAATFHPIPENPTWAVRVRMSLLSDQKTIEAHYDADSDPAVESISALENIMTVTESGKGYLAVPVREGLLIPADSKLTFTHRFDTYAYEGCHMEMLGLVQNGAALLVTWEDPYVAVDIKSAIARSGSQSGAQNVTSSLVLSKSANAFRLHCLGRGDYVSVAKAYRQVAEQKGFGVTWHEKIKTQPERAKLFGAANITLWSALDRRMNEDSSKEEAARVNWTFDEAAQVAEHLKKDLKLDRVLFTLGGWIHRGYDNQHPDILPTAPECGGDSAFTNCAQRVMDQGYLFCLHDNYQDIYRDSPSWDERLVMKTADGKLARGGHWAGGMAFLTCSKTALELAQRPQNLAEVKRLSNANAYFIDTTYAAGLQECFDPEHPLTRTDDIMWKKALSDYARQLFGVFGSECGREWAIPHSDFFEGLTGVSGDAYHNAALLEKLGGRVAPLFELVYRDCIAMYGKYGYDPKKAAPYVLQHICLARPLNYHSIPAHLYWKNINQKPPQGALAERASADLFTHAENGWAAGLHEMDRFIKNTYEILSPLNELTARLPMTSHQFLSSDGKVQRSVFGEGAGQVNVTVNLGESDYTCNSPLGGELRLPGFGFLAESPQFVAFYSRSWNGSEFASPALFTLRSADAQPLRGSHKVRLFHGFGDENIHLGKNRLAVVREEIVDPNGRRPN